MLLGGGGGAAPRPIPQYVERHRTLNRPRRKPASRTRSRSSGSSGRSSSRSSGYHGGSTRTYRGGGNATGYRSSRPARPRFAPGSAASKANHIRAWRAAHPKPKYSGPPPPSASMIAQLYSQLGEMGKQKKMYESDYNRGRSSAYSARELFLKQLADTYTQRQTQTTADFAERGLSQSGLLNEALANLGKQRAQEQSSYQTDFQGRLDQLLAQLTRQRSQLATRRRTVSDRYNQARADRARILKLMGA